MTDTTVRDKIADMLDEADMNYRETGEGPSSHAMADAILAALPELTAPKVKPLVWDKHPDENQWYNVLTDSNYGPEMGYTITETDCCHYKLNMRSGDERVGKYPTFEAADGAAKSHMTQLILSVLVPPTGADT